MTEDFFLSEANKIQISLSAPFLLLAGILLYRWRKAMIDALWTRPWSATAWLVIGIVSSVVSNSLDHIYWGITWALVDFNSYLHARLLDYGPVSNLIVRQSLGLWAIICHLVAANKMNDVEERLPWRLGLLLAGVTYSLLTFLPTLDEW